MMSDKEVEERTINRDIYLSFVEYEKAYRDYIASLNPNPRKRHYFIKNYSIPDRDAFDEYFARQTFGFREHLVGQWQKGFARCLQKQHRQDRKLIRRFERYGVPEKISQRLDRVLKEFGID